MTSRFGEIYERAYGLLAGRYPALRPWHFQWLFSRELNKWHKKRMGELKGRLLDVGCGEKPYLPWVKMGAANVCEYVGLDVYRGPTVDITVEPDAPWPLTDCSFDAVVAAQMLEHVSDPAFVVREISRVLKPGGTLLVSIPFLMPAHGMPHDYQRYTTSGLERLFREDFDIVELTRAGGVGAVLGNLMLISINTSLNANRVSRLCKGILLPLWLPFAFLINMLCLIAEAVDRTDDIYANLCLVARRRAS